MPGYIGVDLDGTLASYDRYRGATHIGPPVPKMLKRVLHWLHTGQPVVIVTARADPADPSSPEAIAAIRAWCLEHLGQELPVTNQKTKDMVELWDDRAVQVVPNTGVRVDDLSAGDRFTNLAGSRFLRRRGG